jgi:hypothetical protein
LIEAAIWAADCPENCMRAFLLILDIFSWLFGAGGPEQRSDMFISRHAVAPAGERAKIAFIPFLYPNCKSYGDVKFGVIAKPEHGDLFLSESAEVLPSDPAHPRPDCDGKTIRGLRIEYLPEPGYSGDDRTLYSIDNQRGETWNYYQTIEVK